MGSERGRFWAVARFHSGVGARLALRAAAPGVAAVFGAVSLLGTDFLISLAGIAYGAGSSLGAWMVMATAAWGIAAAAGARVLRGLGGWLRHLPIDGVAHRRGAVLAMALAEVPLLLGLALLALVAAERPGHPHSVAAALLGLPLLGIAAPLAAVPCRRGWLCRPLAFVASVLAASGRVSLVVAALPLLIAAESLAGPLAIARATAQRARRRSASARLLELCIAWRALGGKLVSAYLFALVPLASGALFLANNSPSELPARDAAMVARLAVGCSLVFLLAGLGEELALRRPAWPWARSLPWSAARRVGADAAILGAHALPLLALAAWREPLPVLAAAAVLPPLAALAAGALRRAPERRTGASGEILLGGMAMAAAVALLPWLALPLVAATPWMLGNAATRERQQRVSRWLELHHLAAGDPQSWSAE